MRYPRKKRALTLAEMMISMLFISIAFFGYISLHLRILHSSTRLEEHEQVRTLAELNMIKMTIASRDKAVPDKQLEVVSPQYSPLPFKITERWTHPDASVAYQKLIADMTWENERGEHGFHLESASRQFKYSW